ncbi:NAD(P)-binding protein [Schizophyllum commune H4-8]|uniref:NAD(P)-binding protein n=1 Tax=Schizophyllum commune (strain H4-8 / FGSC 9210) TaxID=578458 RepID=D8Q098_SCHCM|nr:NAD(P)-binding protein [Schizophyllum commune H4-8]KAI5896706.1 NAD(P)-binding protein [Schizophyllum commune H4-8]
MSAQTVYLVSGANRGFGLGLVKVLLERPNVLVFAGARDPDSAASLKELKDSNPDKLHIVKLVSADKNNNAAAAEEIGRVAGRLDIVIANAGISNCFEGGLTMPAEEMTRHFDINVNGPLLLFQATYDVLKKSSDPKFVAISSVVGSIAAGGTNFDGGFYAYGTSKAALNWVVRKLHHDFEDFVIFPMNPGALDTDMATVTVANEPWLQNALPQLSKPEDNARKCLEQIEKATRETAGGKFLDVEENTTLPW